MDLWNVTNRTQCLFSGFADFRWSPPVGRTGPIPVGVWMMLPVDRGLLWVSRSFPGFSTSIVRARRGGSLQLLSCCIDEPTEFGVFFHLRFDLPNGVDHGGVIAATEELTDS